MNNRPTKFTIDRSKWRSGGDGPYKTSYGQAMLLNPDNGSMCCLGQICEQLGIEKELLTGVGTPGVFSEGLHKANPAIALLNGFLTNENHGSSGLARTAMVINDSPEIPIEDREENLTKLFAEHGYELEFTGEASPPKKV